MHAHPLRSHYGGYTFLLLLKHDPRNNNSPTWKLRVHVTTSLNLHVLHKVTCIRNCKTEIDIIMHHSINNQKLCVDVCIHHNGVTVCRS